MMPDRHGNNRVDSLRNIVRDGRVGLLFLVPGSGTTLRVNGRAELSVDDELRASFAVEGKAPRSVMVIAVEAVYFQCARAIHRSRAVESGQACRSEVAADAGRDPCLRQRQPDRRRDLRPRVAGAGEEDDVVRRAGVP